jgi:tellurite methyltransferase
MTDMRAKWNERYADAKSAEAAPCSVLRDFAHLLPKTGKALDLACGLGGNAIFLARHGLDTLGVDISDVAAGKLTAYAEEHKLPLRAEQHDIVPGTLKPESFDVIVIAYFLDRVLTPTVVGALRHGGLLFHQTFTRETPNPGGPANLAYVLASNELLRLYTGMRLMIYREDGMVGDVNRGLRGEALFIGRKS